MSGSRIRPTDPGLGLFGRSSSRAEVIATPRCKPAFFPKAFSWARAWTLRIRGFPLPASFCFDWYFDIHRARSRHQHHHGMGLRRKDSYSLLSWVGWALINVQHLRISSVHPCPPAVEWRWAIGGPVRLAVDINFTTLIEFHCFCWWLVFAVASIQSRSQGFEWMLADGSDIDQRAGFKSYFVQ